jgi:hypothetical protein
MKAVSLVILHCLRPSLDSRRVGSCITRFGGLHSVHLRYGLHARQVAKATLYTKGSDSFITSTAALIATGRSDPVPGWDLHPL